MPRKQSFRLRFTFWLDMLVPDEQVLGDYVEELKTQRSFAKTIRDGLRLMRDLRAGKVDVLFSLFPWVKAEFLTGVQPQKTAGELELQRQLERLEQHMLALGTSTQRINPRESKPLVISNGPRALNTPKLDLPRFDDDDDMETLVIAKDTNTDSALNFVNSMMRLQQ